MGKIIKNVILGFITILLISSGTIFLLNTGMKRDIKINVNIDNTKFYENSTGRWLVTGIEENRIIKGSQIQSRIRKQIYNYTMFDGTNIYQFRETPYYNKCFVKDTYAYNPLAQVLELFPVFHKIEIWNCSGYFYRYTVNDLYGSYSKLKLINNETTVNFQKNMKVEFEPNYRWAWIGWPYGDDSFSVQYDIKSNYEVFYIKLFDPVLANNKEFNISYSSSRPLNYNDIYVQMSTNTTENIIYRFDWYNITNNDSLVLWHDYSNGNAIDLLNMYNGTVSGIPSETAWWKFDDDGVDSSGNSNTLTYDGTPEFPIFKYYKGGFVNGNGERFKLDGIRITENDSICWWQQCHSFNLDGGAANSCGVVVNTSDSFDQNINFKDIGNGKFEFQDTVGTTYAILNVNDIISFFDINHYCILFDDDASKFYINKNLVGTDNALGSNEFGFNRIGVGYSNLDANATYDDMRFYDDVVLSQTEIDKIYDEGYKALSLFKNDDGMKATFDGTNDYIDMDNVDELIQINASFWGYAEFILGDHTSAADDGYIISSDFPGGGSDFHGFTLYINNGDNDLYFRIANYTGEAKYLSPSSALTPEETYKVFFGFNNVTDEAFLYVNGEHAENATMGGYNSSLSKNAAYDNIMVGDYSRQFLHRAFNGTIKKFLYGTSNPSNFADFIIQLNSSTKYQIPWIDDGSLEFLWVADGNTTSDYKGENDPTRINMSSDDAYEQDSDGFSYFNFDNSSNQYLNMTNINLSNYQEKSIVTMFKLSNDGYNNDFSQPIFSTDYFRTYVYGSTNILKIAMTGASTGITLGSGNTDWHCIVGTYEYNGSHRSSNIYLDLTQSDSKSLSGLSTTQYGEQVCAVLGTSCNASISMTQVYNKVLSEEEARKICRFWLQKVNDTTSLLNSSYTNINETWFVNIKPYNSTFSFESILTDNITIYDCPLSMPTQSLCNPYLDWNTVNWSINWSNFTYNSGFGFTSYGASPDNLSVCLINTSHTCSLPQVLTLKINGTTSNIKVNCYNSSNLTTSEVPIIDNSINTTNYLINCTLDYINESFNANNYYFNVTVGIQ